jgi:hypothetical protein
MSRLGNRHTFTRARAVAIACGLLLGAGAARADNLRIENVTVVPRDAKTATVRFDIAWENSWRHGGFHDAAWVFFKVQADDKSDWQHVRLAADKVLNPSGYGQEQGGTPLEFVVPAGDDGFVGLFVRRAADGKGAVAATKATGVWDFTANTGVKNDGKVRVQAFGIEMVYVGEGSFCLGSGGSDLNTFHTYTGNDRETPPYWVMGAGAIATGRQKGKLWAKGIAPDDNGEIPASFPNGYAAFYCMRRMYFTQALYAGFLNTITAAQAKGRYYTDYQGVAIKRSGKAPNYTYEASNPAERCPWLSWADGAAVAAWAGLRPMTELEYEKSIRGPGYPVDRWDAGLSFWGLDDVNGSTFYERPVSYCNPAGRKFAGSHGRGTPVLPADWPADFNGVVFHGGYVHDRVYYPLSHLCTSARLRAIYAHSDRKDLPFAGWRGVRSAPAGDPVARQAAAGFNPRTVRALARLDKPVRADSVPNGWGEPLAVLRDPAGIFPVQNRFSVNIHTRNIWQGPDDFSAKVYLGRDGEALCVGAVVTDDRHFNTQSGDSISNGDALQMGLVSAKGVHWNLGLALTKEGVAFHQWEGTGDTLLKTADCAVVRDEKAGVTRYGLRLPLAALGLEPGAEVGFHIMFFDDDGTGQRYWLQLAPSLARGGNNALYPRFVLEK